MLLLEAFAEAHKTHPEYILKIYGEGVLRGALENKISEFNLEESAFLMGEKDNIKDEIYKEGIFVLSSDYEGMPNALMEAMALGIPCISTDCPCGGPKYLIKNKKNGILVDINDKNQLKEAMIYLIENKDIAKEIGSCANKICEELNPSVINKKW